MSINSKNLGKSFLKKAGFFVFALLFVLNIQILFLQNTGNSVGNISILGIELTLFNSALAEKSININCEKAGCPSGNEVDCLIIKIDGVPKAVCKSPKQGSNIFIN